MLIGWTGANPLAAARPEISIQYDFRQCNPWWARYHAKICHGP
jgi:hypothetical protein